MQNHIIAVQEVLSKSTAELCGVRDPDRLGKSIYLALVSHGRHRLSERHSLYAVLTYGFINRVIQLHLVVVLVIKWFCELCIILGTRSFLTMLELYLNKISECFSVKIVY